VSLCLENQTYGSSLYVASVDPATTEELGTVPEMGLAETKEAIDAAAKAFKTWGKTTAKVRLIIFRMKDRDIHEAPFKHRHDILMKMFALMQEHHDDLGKIIVWLLFFLGRFDSAHSGFRPSRMVSRW
jgi:acyl-CoA reductase-like NAD-dependent aldehyde dehydrogenase